MKKNIAFKLSQLTLLLVLAFLFQDVTHAQTASSTESASTTQETAIIDLDVTATTTSATSTDMMTVGTTTQEVATTTMIHVPDNGLVWLVNGLVPCTDPMLCVGSWDGTEWMRNGVQFLMKWNGTEWNFWSHTSTQATSTSTTTPGTSTTTPEYHNSMYPSMKLMPMSHTVMTGQSIDFSGTNFPHEEDIWIYRDGVRVGQAHADGGGNFTTGSMSMPSTPGMYTYTFVGATTGVNMSSIVTVQ
ncbi:MAG: hypothetical protein V4519_01290 [Patescibacteria group bacterium]